MLTRVRGLRNLGITTAVNWRLLQSINDSDFQRQRRDEEDRLREMAREFSRSVGDVDPHEMFTYLL